MRTPRRSLAALVLAFVLAPVAAWAQAGDDLTIDILEASLDNDGATEVTVSVTGGAVTGVLDPSVFTIREDGALIEDITASPIEDVVDPPTRVALLLLDTSTSTEGEPLENALSAAATFVRDVTAAGVDVGLVTFADEARLVAPPSADADAVLAAIGTLEAAGETAFYDAVIVAARTLQNFPNASERTIVAFTDGGDTTSQATLEAAVNAAEVVDASVSSVALQTGDLDPAALEALATATRGQVQSAGDAGDLAAAFGQIATSLTSQYVITYTSLQARGEFDLAAEVTVGEATSQDQIRVLSPRTGGAGEPRAIDVTPSPLYTNRTILWAAIGGVGLAIALILGLLLVPAGDARVIRTLERGLRGARRENHGHTGSPRASGHVGERAVSIIEAVPKPEGYDERLQMDLDRASWPLRSAEFTTLRVLAAFVGGITGWGLFASVILGVILAVAGWFVPRVVVAQRVAARRKKFLEQLPDTLQLLSGSLKAGYGILQGIDTIVQEVAAPMSVEFQRVLTETRLGLPLDEALESMAERVDSDDFRWVTVAIAIQRRVGGNLADLLETVSETLRDRENVRRQIDVLSAEGRLSAVILTLLPFGLAGYLAVVNPEYIGQLFSQTAGHILILGAVLLMGVGVLWMRRLIDIDV